MLVCYVVCDTAYMSSPCHIEVILAEKEQAIAKPTEEEKKKVSQKKLKRQKMMMREWFWHKIDQCKLTLWHVNSGDRFHWFVDIKTQHTDSQLLLGVSEYCVSLKCTFSALLLLVGRQEGHQAFKNWVAGCWRAYLFGVRCECWVFRIFKIILTVGPTRCTHNSGNTLRIPVIRREDDVDGWVSVTKDEERSLRGGWTVMRLCRYEGCVVVRTL